MDKRKQLIGTKFLFNTDLIEYKDLVQLLENNGLNTRFIQKPIKDNLEVHSLYIKPDFELTFLVKASGADEYYSAAAYNCINYKEIELYDVLKLLGYLDVRSQKDVQKEKKPKKSKFVTFEHENIICSYKKKYIQDIKYFKKTNMMWIKTKDYEIQLEDVDIDLYNSIMSQL